MLFFLDSADPKEIARALEVFPLAGITTSPSIITKCKRDYFAILRDIRALIGDKMLHTQMMGSTEDEIIRDAETVREKTGGNLYVKVPVSLEGYKAMPVLKKRGFRVTATTIHTPMQALTAACHGVDFAAPYLNHIDDVANGPEAVKTMADLFRIHQLNTKLLIASFRNVRQVEAVALAGAHAVTISPDVMWKLIEHPLTGSSLEKFRKDWDAQYGPDKCIYNLD